MIKGMALSEGGRCEGERRRGEGVAAEHHAMEHALQDGAGCKDVAEKSFFNILKTLSGCLRRCAFQCLC